MSKKKDWKDPKDYLIEAYTNKLINDYKQDDEKEQERQRQRALSSPSTSNSTNSPTFPKNSSYGSQAVSQSTPAERDLFKITGRRHTVTDRRRGIDKNEKTQRTANISGQNRGLSRDGNDRFTNTVKGAGKQWLGGQLSGIGTTAQADIVNINSIRGARAERENDYRLTSREEAERREAESVNKSRTKDGVNLRDMERRYSLEPEGNVSDNYRKIVKGTQSLVNKGDSLIESGTQDIEKAKEGATDFEKFLIDNGAQLTQWAGDASLRLIPVVGQALSMGGFFNRAGGMSAYQGRQEGMNPDQQFKYYAGSGLMEVLSELTFQSVGALRATYGKGMFSIADKLTTKASTSGIVNRLLNNTELGKSLFINMARLGGNAVEEGLEEVETDLVDPLLKYYIKKSEDPRAEFEGWDLQQMGYDFLMGATMGGVLGVAEVPSRVKYELNIANSDAFNDGMTTSLIKQASVQGRQSDGGRLIPTNAELLAQQLQQQMDNNIPVQPAQIRMLQEAIGQSISENQKQLTRKMTQEYDKAQKSGDLVQMEGTRMESQGIDNASVKLYDDATEKARQVLGEDATQEEVEAVAGVTTGLASTNEIDTVLAKPELKKAVETIVNEGADAESAVSIPVNNAEARDVLENLTAVKRIANRNTILKDVQAKNADIIKSSVDNMSEGGKNLFASRAEFAQDTIGGNRDRNLEIYRDRFSRLYTDGNTKGADFETSYKRIIGSLDSEALKSVFTEDFARQIFEEGRNAIVTNTAKETAKSRAEEYANRKGGLTFENNNENLISSREREELQKFAERVGVEINVVKSLSKDASGKALMSRTGKKLVVNGKYKDGVITIASDAQNKLITVAKHELTHHLKETSPEMYQKLEDFVFERWYHGNAEEMEDEIARYTKLYSGQGLDRDGVREEIIADASEAFFTDEGAIQDAISFSEKLGRAIHDGIKTMLDAFLGLQDADSRRMRGYGGFLKDLGILQEAERMWLEALEDTQQRKRNARGNTTTETTTESEAKNSLSDEDFIVRDGTARWTEDRIDDLIKLYGASDENYSRAYAVLMNPRDFLKLTLSDETLDEWNRLSSKVDPIKGDQRWIFRKLDRNDLANRREDAPYLQIYSNDGTMVQGHEGRHRMRALLEAGVKSVPVAIRDTDTKYTKTNLESMTLSSQDFGYDPVNNGAEVTVRDLIPIKASNRDELIQKFGGEADVKFSVSAEDDQTYLDAVNRGDMKTAQKMVDEEAKKHGYNVKAYHGTPNEKFTVFNADITGWNGKKFGRGNYFSSERDVAKNYAGKSTKIGEDGTLITTEGGIYDTYLNLGNSYTIDLDEEIAKGKKGIKTYSELSNKIYAETKLSGVEYDSVTIKNIKDGSSTKSDVYIVADPNRIKSADPVTYDDDGNVIPLSQRFNESNEDIRYSVTTENEPLPKGGKIPKSMEKWAKKVGLETLSKQDSKVPVNVSVRSLRSYWYAMNGRTDEARTVNNSLRSVADALQKLSVKYKYIGLDDAMNATVHYRTDEKGRPTSVYLTCQVKNAEYEINYDFTTICAKRAPLQKVLERFIKTEGERMDTLYDELKLDEDGMYKLRLILEQAGFEVSCIACFVEQNRYSQQAQAETVATDWNKALDEWARENGTRVSEHFNLASLDLKSIPFEEIKKGFTNYYKLMRDWKTAHPKESANVAVKNRMLIEAIPYFRKRMNPSEYASIDGQRALMAMGNKKTNLYNLLKRGQGYAKQSVPFVAYNGEVALLPDRVKNKSLFNYLMSIGGARAQSASDFQIEYVFDYMQMVADLSARRLPMHMYTKVIELAELFGKTGIKINLSAMCAVDNSVDSEYAGLKKVNGRWVYNISDQSIDYNKAVKLQRQEGYSKNIGIIMVTLSKYHMLKALGDKDVRYIIGYHSSKMPAVVSKASDMESAMDCTKINKTNRLNDKGRELFDRAMSIAKGDTELERYKNALRIFDDMIQKEVSKEKADKRPRRGNEYSRYMTGFKANTADFDVYNDIKSTKDPRKTADNYIQYCMDNDLIPMYFPFAFHENYYKCEVYDFNMFDNNTGEYAPMEAVQNVYPDLDMTKGETDTTKFMGRVSKYMNAQNKKNKELEPKYQEVERRAKETLRIDIDGNDHMDMDAMEIDPNEYKHRADVLTDIRDGKASVSEDSDGNKLSEGQREFFKDSKIVDSKGNLKVMYHGSPNDFDTFDIKRAKAGLYGRGFYFTEDKSRASQYGKTYGVYLDVETPLQTGTHDITRAQLKNFIKVLAEDEDYGIENYGYGATVDSVLKSVWGKDDFAMLQDLNATAVGDFAEAVKLFNKVNGTSYDGIVAPTETIAFYPEQIKETSNKKPTKNPNMKFSVTEPVEETKDLLAVHNLKTEDLRGALDLGGFPMPSIAIIKADAGHNAYGEYSAVFDKSTIDPSVTKKNVVYGGDAWTPTFPRMQYKANDRVSRKISQLYYDRSRDLGYETMRPLQRLANEPNEELDSVGGEAELKEAYKKNKKMMRMFLRMNNNDVEDVVNRTEDSLSDVEIRRSQHFIDALGEDAIREFEGKNVPNGSEKAKHRIEWAKLHKAEIENAYADYMKKEWDFTDEDTKEVLADTKFIELMNFIRDAMNYLNNGATTVRESIDQDATDKAVEQRAKAEGYDKWVDDLLNGIEEKRGIRNNKDVFTPSGNRRSWEALHDEPTLLKIVQIMSAQENGETFLGSSLKAVAQKQYRNITEIRADKGRLKTISEEEYKTLMDGFAERENDIITRIDNASPTYESNPFIRHADIRTSIVDNVRRGLSKTAFLKDLQKYANTKGATAKDVDDIFDLVRDVANIPTGYFEAKPKRPVTFYEVKALLAPSDAPTDLISRLQDEGVNVVQYEAGNDEDRIAKLNQASEESNLKFSVSDDEVLDRYIVDRQKRIDDGEQMSFFGSLNETIPSKPKEKTMSEKFYDNVLKTIANIKKKGSWSGFEVKGLFLQYPEFNFIERLNNKADETAVSDFNAFLSSFDKIDDLRSYNWFFSAYENSSQWKKANRSGKMKFNKLIENRIEEIMAGKAHGRNVGIEKRDYTPKEMRKLFNELNTDKELKELGKKVFDCIDKNFDVKFQGVANIEGFKHGQGGTLGQAGGRTVHLNMKYLNSEGYTDQQKASTILHESIHTVTVYALRNRNNYTMPKNIQDACDVIEDVFWQIKNDPSFKGEYGVSKGAEEMVAELANPTFRAKLKAKNVFARVIEAIRNILGINVEVGSKANAFKEVNSALETLMSNADVVSFERYANKVSKDYNGKFSVSEEDENAPTPKEYQTTIAKLEEKVADLKSEFKRTDLKTADPKQTRIQAGRLLKRHDSNLTIQDDVVDAFSKIHRLYKEKGIDAFEEASQIALDTAKQVVSGIAIIHDEGAEQQKEIREFLKDNEIIVSPYIEKNMDDFSSFRKKNAFRLKLKRGEVSNLDKYIYPRLQELFPTAFPDEYYKANNKEGGENTDVLVDMLRHIGDVLDNPMYEIETIDELTPEWKEYVSDIASDIMETAYGLQVKKTFADKKYEEKVRAVAKAREEALASRDRALAKQAERYETKISYLKQRNKDFKEETKERAEKNRRIAQIAGIHKRLLEKLDNPKDTKHLPDGYAPIVSNVLSMFDFTTPNMVIWTGRHGEPSKRYRYLDELRKRLADMSKEDSPIAESGFEIDPDIIEIIEEIKADVADTDRLSDLDSATLEDIYTLFKAFEHQLNTFNKAFDENNRQTVTENRDNFISETRDKKTRKDKQGTIGWLQRQLETNNTTPEDFFHLIGGTPEKLYKSIRKGFDKHILNVKSAMDFIEATVDSKDVKKWSENVREYTTSLGDKIKLTDAQLMSVYCLSKREQAQQHMYSEKGGKGISVAPQKVGKGLKAEDIDRAKVVVSSSDIQKWISQLSDKQREVADQFQRYLSDDMSKLGNETALKLYGYKKFTEKNYFPIQSSENWLNSTFDFSGGDAVLKNVGMTKAVNKFANNPIVIDDIFTVASKHISTMSLYNSLVPPLTDFQRFWNSKDNDHDTTVKEEFERVYGKPALKYVDNFMRDLNGSYKRGFEVEGVDKLMSKYKQASIGLNLRVLFQQPTAVARAGAVMNPMYITKALGASTTTLKQNLKDMREHCPIALWKSWGFYNTDLARDMRSIMMNEKTLSDNFSKAYGIADDLTWSVIFKAVRYEVEAQNKNLEVGSDEYWEKVNERASEVFDRTQVVDSPFHRSQNMRAKDNLSKMVTAFMAEPTKTYNMLKTELTLAKREIQSGQKAQGVKRASRVVQVFVTNALLVSASSAVIDALRGVGGSGDDDKDKNWFERFLAHWWTNTKENLNPFGLLPVFKDVQSVVQGYDVTRMDMQAIGRMVKSLQYMGEYIKEPENSKYTFKNEAHYLLQQSAYLVGLPLANLERDTRGVALSIAEAVGYDDLFFEEAKFKYQVNDKTKSMWTDMYLDAKYKGNTALAKKIKDYITSNDAVTEEYIEEREKKYKKDNKSASQQQAFDSSIQTLETSPIWNSASEDNKEYYTGVLENLSVGIENQSTEYVTKLAKNGLTNEQVILYKLALKKVDKPSKNGNYGSYTNAEKEDAIRLLERYYNLTQAQKDTLMGK